MTTQTLTIGKRRFVLLPERDFLRLQARAAKPTVNKEFADEAMSELRAYRRTRKAVSWTTVKGKLGL